MLVAIDGVAGAGKTTLLSELHSLCSENGIHTCVVEEFPSEFIGGYISRARINDPYVTLHSQDFKGIAQTLLFASAHAYKYEAHILPALLRGQVVLVDRYTDSLIAFQSALLASANIMQQDSASAWVHECVRPLPAAELVVLVSPPDTVVHQRRVARGDRITSSDTHFSRLVADAYRRQLAVRASGTTLIVSNAGSLEATAKQCLDCIQRMRASSKCAVD